MSSNHEHNQWAKQWNRYACTVSDCTVFKTLDMGIEYDDPTGHLDPYEIESQAQPEAPTDAPKPSKVRKKQADTPNVDGETQDDLVATLNGERDGDNNP